MTQFDIVANRPIPNVNLRQIVWQPVKDNGNLSMRLAPIEWQPSGAHACIQMLADDLAKTMEALRWAYDTLKEINPSNYTHDDVCNLNDASVEAIIGIRDTLAELEGKE